MASVLGNRRPLDLDSDDETEGEDKQPTGPKTTEQVIAEADELIVKKKVRHSKPFTEDVLTHPDGIQRIYEEFPVSCKFRGRGSETKDLKKLLTMYREWAFQLHPGLAFPDIISKCESLGSKGKTRSCILNLRERERTRYIKEVLDVISAQRDPDAFARAKAAPAAEPATTSIPRSTESANEKSASPDSEEMTGTVLDLSDIGNGDVEKRSPSLQEEEEEF